MVPIILIYAWLSLGFASVLMRYLFLHNMARDMKKDGYDACFDSPPLLSVLYNATLFIPVYNLWLTLRWILNYDWLLSEAKRQIDEMDSE